jgi:hypothetical protein
MDAQGNTSRTDLAFEKISSCQWSADPDRRLWGDFPARPLIEKLL